MDAKTIDAYNKAAAAYAKKFNEIGSRANDVTRGFSYFKRENPKVLELGCGNGRDAKEILKFTNNYLGIDASEEMIKLAKEYLPNAKFLVADAEEFDYPQNLDIIFAFASLLHFNRDSIKKILEKAHAAFNAEGIFYISVKKDNYHEKIKNDEFGSRTFYFYTEQDFRELAAGKFDVVYVDEQNLRGTEWLTVVLQKQ